MAGIRISRISLISLILLAALFTAARSLPVIEGVNGEKKIINIQTSFGLNVSYFGNSSQTLSVDLIDSPLNATKIDDNNTLNVFFNISSPNMASANLTLTYHFNYAWGERVAEFYPETLVFGEVVRGVPESFGGGEVDMVSESLSQNFGDLDLTENRTFTILGVKDESPPSPVNVTSLNISSRGELTVDFDTVPDAFGYYLYLTETKCVDVGDRDPYLKELIYLPPIVLTSIEEGKTAYLSIAPVDIAGNVNPSVECRRFEMSEPNRSPQAKIDPVLGTYYANEVVYFTTRGTMDPDPDDVLSYSWDLDGDGIFDSTEENPTFIYGRPGDYSVTLRITDDGGLSDTDTVKVTISGTPSAEDGEGAGRVEGKTELVMIIALVLITVSAFLLIVGRVRKSKRSDLSEGSAPDKTKKLKFIEKNRGSKRKSKTGGLDPVTWTAHPYSEKYVEWTTESEKSGEVKGWGAKVEEVEEETREVRRNERPAVRYDGEGESERRKEGKAVVVKKYSAGIRATRTARKRRSKTGGLVSTFQTAGTGREIREQRREYSYYLCESCNEVLRMAVFRKGGTIKDSYTVSCPCCGEIGKISLDR